MSDEEGYGNRAFSRAERKRLTTPIAVPGHWLGGYLPPVPSSPAGFNPRPMVVELTPSSRRRREPKPRGSILEE
jgi:hypothetical protein